jgi:uncharacterized membrane protein YqjE
MAISDTVGRLGATLLAMLQTRIELAALELEEESQRLLGYLLVSLLALFLCGIAIVLVALLVIVLCWDSYRIEAVLGLVVLFGGSGIALGLKVRAGFGAKPRLLGATLCELNKDINYVRNAGRSDEP